MHFGQKKRFEVEADETIVARAGTQMNCGGIAAIRVRMKYVMGSAIEFYPLALLWIGLSDNETQRQT